ncbi:lysM domain-containing GPI-anchored protein 2-like [Senna tora]|uniref:LysM domain-containing GPI-anchored protein 2-like n=1 Tax=Senna tora TaxID=362788 RepID=A0A834XEY1_9FABA|nr:lysM domain-containing GPI-anchored protein 2-like [Senna tora]
MGTMSRGRVFVLLIIVRSLAATASASFGCDEASTCRSLVGYKPQYRTTLGAIQTLFNVSDTRDIAGANGLPEWTPRDHTVDGNQRIRIPLECECYEDEGGLLRSRSKNRLKYKLKAGDTLYKIGMDVFSGLVDYKQIEYVNPDAVPVNLTIGREVIIPFLCGESETVVDIPFPVCSTMVRNDSLDYPLLVPNGTYMYTANGCVKCKCDAANNWTLHCEPSKLKPTNWSTRPSMQCNNSSNMYIGNTTSSDSHNVTFCAYAGYGNQTIFPTLATQPTPPDINLMNAEESRWWIWLVVVGGLIVVTILCYLIWRKYITEVDRKWKQNKLISEIGNSTVASILYYKAKGNRKDGKTNHEMQIFNFESIVTATDNFSIANKLGEGGFGPVYKVFSITS